MSAKGNVNSTATGGVGGGSVDFQPDEISRSPEHAPANGSDDVAYSTASEKDRHLNVQSQDFKTSHEKSLDEESGGIGQVTDDPSEHRKQFVAVWYRKLRPLIHFLIWALWTIWWAYGLAMYRDRLNWLIPFLLWLAITIRIVTLYVPARYALKPFKVVWRHTVFRVYEVTPEVLHKPLAAAGTIAIFLIGSMVSPEDGENTRASRAQALFGLLVMVGLMTVTSRNPKAIPWHTVIGGMLTQFVVAVFVLRTKVGYDIFEFISFLARTLLGFAKDGTAFLTDDDVPKMTWFLVSVIPPIIFFVALVSLCYYMGLIQWFVSKFAVIFFWTLRVSGAEAVVAAATPFIGQGESAMLIRPFVPHLTLAEIHQVMSCGFATIAGSVLIVYINMGLNAQALVSSCIMSIPASLAISKMRYPETEETLTSGRVVVPDDEEEKASNALHAFANGAWLGLKIAGMIIATLLCIVSFVKLIDGFLGWWAGYWGMLGTTKLTLQLILGYIFYPVAWLLGVPNQDLLLVGELIGQKVIMNEFVAFDALTDPEGPYVHMAARSKLIATYACCGFGNVGSLGTQIGVLTQIAPNRGGDVSKVALSALASGIIATLTSASIAGMLATEGIIESVTSTTTGS